jgi:protoporphyrinogen oxidase
MAAAFDLARAGRKVTIFEAADHVGGLASGFKEPQWDWSVEKFYHHWFASDRHILELIDELGCRDKVIFPRPYTVMYHNGKFYPFDSIPTALRFPALGWGLHKIRFGLVGSYLRLSGNWRSLERVTADAWMRKWAGRHVYELMWRPLLLGKFSEKYAQQVNMAWMWARLKARTTRLGTFRGGFQAFADVLADRLRQSGVDIRLSTVVRQIASRPGGGFTIDTAYDVAHFDRVLATTSPAALAGLAPSLPQAYLKGLLNLKSMGAVVIILALKHQLSREGFYWFSLPKSAGFPFLALVEHTNFISPDYFGGDHIVYIGDYLNPDHEYFRLSQEKLVERFLPSLSKINPDFSQDWVRKVWLFRTNYAQPVPLLNQSKNIPSIETPLPGFYFASMSQVYPWDRGTNFAVALGRKVAKLILAS